MCKRIKHTALGYMKSRSPKQNIARDVEKEQRKTSPEGRCQSIASQEPSRNLSFSTVCHGFPSPAGPHAPGDCLCGRDGAGHRGASPALGGPGASQCKFIAGGSIAWCDSVCLIWVWVCGRGAVQCTWIESCPQKPTKQHALHSLHLHRYNSTGN